MIFMHQLLKQIVEATILLFEYMGTFVLLLTGLKGIIGYLRHNPDVRLNLAKGFAMGLEFKLGGEILKTVIINDLSELYIVGGIIILRAALTFLIHWEMQGEAPKREGPEILEAEELKVTS